MAGLIKILVSLQLSRCQFLPQIETMMQVSYRLITPFTYFISVYLFITKNRIFLVMALNVGASLLFKDKFV